MERRRGELVAFATRAAQVHLDAGHHADARRASAVVLRHDRTKAQAVRVAAQAAVLAEEPTTLRRVLDGYDAALQEIGVPRDESTAAWAPSSEAYRNGPSPPVNDRFAGTSLLCLDRGTAAIAPRTTTSVVSGLC